MKYLIFLDLFFKIMKKQINLKMKSYIMCARIFGKNFEKKPLSIHPLKHLLKVRQLNEIYRKIKYFHEKQNCLQTN